MAWLERAGRDIVKVLLYTRPRSLLTQIAVVRTGLNAMFLRVG